jgi:endonuclease/exonuclease/phosphatase family metal-dependent hydrolase
MRRQLSLMISFCVLITAAVCPAGAESDKRVLKVMTRNMDAGTDLGWFFVVPDVTTATALTLNEVLASDIPGRAELLADEIAARQPDFIALQEVTLWQVGPPNGTPVIVLDQLELLLSALRTRHLDYAPVIVNPLTSVAAPASNTEIVSFTDRDAILARTDLKQSEMALSNIQRHIYQAKFGFPIAGTTIPVLRGWESVDVKVRGKVFRLVDTHLESTIPGIPSAEAVQVAQANELLGELRTTALPVVLAGDFNANAEATPDHTATTDNILAAGFTDTWRVFNNPFTGFTWPLFLEDFAAGRPIQPFERIDLIFTRYLNTLDVQQSGLNAPYPSDHAGTVAVIEIVP